jgi:hypothetical protein
MKHGPDKNRNIAMDVKNNSAGGQKIQRTVFSGYRMHI